MTTDHDRARNAFPGAFNSDGTPIQADRLAQMSTSLDRKLESAARRAEADRKARGGFTPVSRPAKAVPPAAPTPAPSPAPATPQKRFYNDVGTRSPGRAWCPAPGGGGGWYDFFGDNSVIYTTNNGEPPADDMSNVTGSKTI